MEAAFAWLGQLMQTLGSLVPTWVHVECIEAAVAITRGSIVRELPPGVHFYWPFWTEVYAAPRKRQTTNLPTQSLITADGQRVVVGGMVRYTIEDALLALVETHDVDNALVDESLAVICQYVTQKGVSEVQEDRNKVNTELTLKIRSQLKLYGLYVERAQLTDFATALVLNHVANLALPQAVATNREE